MEADSPNRKCRLVAWLEKHRTVILGLGFLLLLIAYAIQALSPLRLDGDSVRYLMLAANAYAGKGFSIEGVPSQHPVGYPLLLLGLHYLGVATPAGFIMLNVISLIVGLGAQFYLLRRYTGLTPWFVGLVVFLTALSFLFIKHTTIPLSELPFFAASMASLALLPQTKMPPLDLWPRMILAGIGIVVACSIRTAGVALIPAALWAFLLAWPGGSSSARERILPRRALEIVGVVILAIPVIWLTMKGTSYHSEFIGGYSAQGGEKGWLTGVATLVAQKLSDIPFIVINVPKSLVPAVLIPTLSVIGIAIMGTIIIGLYRQRWRLGVLEVYAAAAVAIAFLWPYHEIRFWLPVVPFLIFYGALALRPWICRSSIRILICLWIGWFVLMGTVALAFVTNQTFAAERFADMYGDGTYRESYRAALRGEPLAGRPEIYPAVYCVLRRYEPLSTPGSLFEDVCVRLNLAPARR